jgi:hypothetical protein
LQLTFLMKLKIRRKTLQTIYLSSLLIGQTFLANLDLVILESTEFMNDFTTFTIADKLCFSKNGNKLLTVSLMLLEKPAQKKSKKFLKKCT